MSEKKPGFMARLFGRKFSLQEDSSYKKEDKTKKLQQMQTVEDDVGNDDRKKLDVPKRLDRRKSEPAKGKRGQSGVEAGGKGGGSRARKPHSGGGGRANPQAKRAPKKKGKKGNLEIDVDVNKPIEYPAVPEVILAYHRKKPFLSQNEEWLLVELNEYECLVSDLNILKLIAKHSKFFEVEPDELWDEFFEFMEEVPTYDEIINYDVWQEFRDEKYPY